jgi:hypothetical protein
MQQTNAMDYVYHVGRLSKQCSNLLLVWICQLGHIPLRSKKISLFFDELQFLCHLNILVTIWSSWLTRWSSCWCHFGILIMIATLAPELPCNKRTQWIISIMLVV